MKNLFVASLFALLLLTGCSQKHIINYAPSSVMTIKGSTNVGEFNYLPAKDGKIKMNQIKNTAMGSIIFEKNINEYYKRAVFSESRLVGIDISNNSNIIEGDINKFIIDDLGYSIDWTLDVRYIVKNKSSKDVCYDKTKLIQKNSSKFINFFGTLNEVMKLNIEELFKDDDFKECIKLKSI